MVMARMTTADVLPTFEQLVERWKVYSRRDAIDRYDLFSQMALFLRYNTGEQGRLAKAIDLQPHTFALYLRITDKFTRSEVNRLVAKGYGWSHLVRMTERANTEATKERALAPNPPRIVKAELNARPTGSRSRWSSTRDRFIVALSEASPEQIANWLEAYVRESCTPERAKAIVRGLSRLTDMTR